MLASEQFCSAAPSLTEEAHLQAIRVPVVDQRGHVRVAFHIDDVMLLAFAGHPVFPPFVNLQTDVARVGE